MSGRVLGLERPLTPTERQHLSGRLERARAESRAALLKTGTASFLVCGVLASVTHVVSTFAFGGNPYIPSLGASGAISGVLGGYLLLHPRRLNEPLADEF